MTMTRARSVALPPDEDGYELWLRYRLLPAAARRRLRRWAQAVVLPGAASALQESAASELERALGAMLGATPPRVKRVGSGGIVLATPRSLPRLRQLALPFDGLGDEGYVLRATVLDGHRIPLTPPRPERGLLCGASAWLRALNPGAAPPPINIISTPPLPLRLLNHWDNLDR